MSHPSGTARDGRILLAIALAIAALGCGTELPPPDASNPLPPGIPSDTGQYRQLIARDEMGKVSHRRERKAKCLLCSKIVVTIQAVGNTLAIDPENGPVAPVRVAHLVNTDKNKIEKYYGLLPQDSAEYDLWVSRKKDTVKAQWTLVQVSITANSVLAAKARDLNYCHLRKPGDPKDSDADFAEYTYGGKKCDYPIPEPAQKVSRASLFPTPVFASFLTHLAAILVQYAESGGGWIDCNNGCCT
ncbi:MAG TPA: hypothetical protein VK493_11835 [Bryobacteraceae bacterium]|nr:hypothetical protein [Bryobacteraceae bacterium]